MGKCTICGKPAGLFRSEHAQCRTQYDQARQRIRSLVRSAFKDKGRIATLRDVAQRIVEEGQLLAVDAVQAVVEGIDDAISYALQDNVLTREEEDGIIAIKSAFDDVIDPSSMTATNQRLVKAAILRDLQSGQHTSRVNVKGYLPFRLTDNEAIVWLFDTADLLESKTRTRYVGGSHGMSFKVMSGVYYRVGAHRGERIQTQHIQHVDTGPLLITDRNIHFKGDHKALRIPLKKIISLEAHADGITLYKDGASPKPLSFIIDDPWFAANAINLLD